MPNYIYYEISNTINFEAPDIEEDDLASSFPHIFGNKNFSFEVSFFANTFVYGANNGIIPVSNVSVISSSDFVHAEEISTNSIRITQINNPFDEKFLFTKIENGSITEELVDITNIADFELDERRIVAWVTPEEETANTNAIEVGEFELQFQAEANTTFTQYTQKYYWDPTEGYLNLQTVLEKIE